MTGEQHEKTTLSDCYRDIGSGMDVSDLFFSNQPATESSKVSGGLCHRMVERVNDTFHLDMTEKQQLAMAEKSNIR